MPGTLASWPSGQGRAARPGIPPAAAPPTLLRPQARPDGGDALEPASQVDHATAQLPVEPAKVPTDWGKKPPPSPEVKFLRGPQRRGSELFSAVRFFWQLIRGMRGLHFV